MLVIRNRRHHIYPVPDLVVLIDSSLTPLGDQSSSKSGMFKSIGMAVEYTDQPISTRSFFGDCRHRLIGRFQRSLDHIFRVGEA